MHPVTGLPTPRPFIPEDVAMYARKAQLAPAATDAPTIVDDSPLRLHTDKPAAYLGATALIDRDHPDVRWAARRVCRDARSDRRRALSIFQYVRDAVRFGWTSDAWREPASRTLNLGVGYCHTKTALFIAMLRSAGIPARMRFVELDSSVLAGLVRLPDVYVDHAFAEVWIDHRWVGVDAYVVDRPMFDKARQRLIDRGAWVGFGIHRDGHPRWDGRSPVFSQRVDSGRGPTIIGRDLGIYADSACFYADGIGRMELDGLRGYVTRCLLPVASARAAMVRRAR